MELSIIVPCYNVEKYIFDCLTSIKDIRHISYEIILVNDGSTDGTLAILEEFKRTYSGFCTLISQENKGQSCARNVGLTIAVGKYICFLDSDDYVDSEKLEMLVRRVIADNVEIGFGDYIKKFDEKFFDVKEVESRYKKLGNKAVIYTGIDYAEKIYERKKNRIISEVCFSIYSNDFVKNNNLYFKEGIYHEDTLFFYQSIIKASRVKYYRINFYIYNVHSGSTMTSEEKIQKRKEDKLCIAYELMDIKNELKKDYYFIDSYIINLCYASRDIINCTNSRIKVKEYKKLTLKSLLMLMIMKYRGII